MWLQFRIGFCYGILSCENGGYAKRVLRCLFFLEKRLFCIDEFTSEENKKKVYGVTSTMHDFRFVVVNCICFPAD